MFNFPLKKSSQDRQTLQNSDENQYSQYWILRLVVFTRFPPNRDCLLKLYMLVNQLEQFLVSFTGKNVSTLGLLHLVDRRCCDNTLLLRKTYLHAVYHRPMTLRIKTIYFVLLGNDNFKTA